MGLLQGRCLHLVLSCHPAIRQRYVFPDCTSIHQIRLGVVHNSMPFTVIVSYVVIALNLKRKVPPYSSGAVSSARKLTVRLLIVIVLSTVTFFPFFFILSLK